MNHIQTMADAYIEAIYFTETGDCGQPENDAKLTPYSKMRAYLDCRNFYWAVTEELGVQPNLMDWAQAGHDLWLTRNGHGVGFFDRPDDAYEALEDDTNWTAVFSAMAKAMGSHDVEFEESEDVCAE